MHFNADQKSVVRYTALPDGMSCIASRPKSGEGRKMLDPDFPVALALSRLAINACRAPSAHRPWTFIASAAPATSIGSDL